MSEDLICPRCKKPIGLVGVVRSRCSHCAFTFEDALERIAQLEAALEKYGHHRPTCHALHMTALNEQGYPTLGKCSCGWQVLESEARNFGE